MNPSDLISYAQEQKIKDTLVITLRKDLPPLSFLSVEGQPAGLFVDMWKLWAEKTGRKIGFRAESWNDTLESLKKGTADIHGALDHSEERAQWIAFSQPIYEFSQCVFFPKNQEKIQSITELKGKKTGVTGGSAQEQDLCMFNLIGNSVKFTEKGFVKISAKCKMQNGGMAKAPMITGAKLI